jgi:hypothetical protein
MASHRPSHPLLHWLAIMALLVNALLPGWAHAAWAQAGGNSATAAGIDLCLSSMSASDAAASHHSSDDGAAMSADMACCAICLSHTPGAWADTASEQPARISPSADGTRLAEPLPAPPTMTPVWSDDAARAPPR